MEKDIEITIKNTIKVKPKKRLGQNFLTEATVISKLVAAAEIGPGQTILEIGPGTGNLTEKLIETGNKVLAIEKDPEMIPALEKRFAGKANFELRRGDILEFDETKIESSYKIVANLPFYLTGALIRKFLESKNFPATIAVIVQKEVAQRVCANPPDMNLLAVSTQFYAKPEIISYISKGCFWPAPKVDCAILKLTPYPKTGKRAETKFVARFFKVMKAGFAQPRKQLAGNLAKGLKKSRAEIEEALKKNGIDPKRRAETLTLENWTRLADEFEL